MPKSRIEVINNRLQARIIATLESLDPNSPEINRILFGIGTMLRNMAIGNISRLGAVDQGRLRASINFQIESNGESTRLIVGAFGLKYARIVELGGAFTDQMRKAMFASFRARGLKPREGKGIIRDGYYRARPYLGPALANARPEITAQFRELVAGKLKGDG